MLKEYFNFTRSERYGVWILLLLIAGLFLCMIIYPYFKNKKENGYSEFVKEINTLVGKAAEKDSVKIHEKRKTFFEHSWVDEKEIPPPHPITLSYFNPNELEEDKWEDFGFIEKQAKIISKYRAAGGKFYKKEDLKKIWSITDEQYNRVKPYVMIPEEKKPENPFLKKDSVKYKKKTDNYLVELNSADTSLLQVLPGIGSGFSSKNRKI